MKQTVPPLTEKRLILSVLHAHQEEPMPKWGITPLGWHIYAHYWSKEVRDTVRSHPDCPAYLRAAA